MQERLLCLSLHLRGDCLVEFYLQRERGMSNMYNRARAKHKIHLCIHIYVLTYVYTTQGSKSHPYYTYDRYDDRSLIRYIKVVMFTVSCLTLLQCQCFK